MCLNTICAACKEKFRCYRSKDDRDKHSRLVKTIEIKRYPRPTCLQLRKSGAYVIRGKHQEQYRKIAAIHNDASRCMALDTLVYC